MTEYAEKLKDPRWQKRRLEILERDQWCCQKCYDGDSTLHVHHLAYFPDLEPWQIQPACLVTLCEECHIEESNAYAQAKKRLLLALAACQFFAKNLDDLAESFERWKQPPREDWKYDMANILSLFREELEAGQAQVLQEKLGRFT